MERIPFGMIRKVLREGVTEEKDLIQSERDHRIIEEWMQPGRKPRW